MKNEEQHDWEGFPVPDGEDPNKIVPVWEITPCLDGREYDMVLIRGYQDMLEYVETNLDNMVSSYTVDDLREGVTIKLRLINMQIADIPEPKAE